MSIFHKKRNQSTKIVQEHLSPSERSGHLLLQDDRMNYMYLIGGYNQTGGLHDIWSFNILQNQWNPLLILECSQSRSNPLPRYDFSGCMVNNEDIYIFGGMSIEDEQISIFNDLWKFQIRDITPFPSSSSFGWMNLCEECPVHERYGHIVECIDNTFILIHGGECMDIQYHDTWVYDINRSIWMSLPERKAMPCARSFHSSTMIQSKSIDVVKKLVLFGGLTKRIDSEGMIYPQYLNDIWILDCIDPNPELWMWTTVLCHNIAPSPRDLPAMISISHNQIIIYAGYGLVETDNEDENENDGGNEDDVENIEDEELQYQQEENNTTNANVTIDSEVDVIVNIETPPATAATAAVAATTLPIATTTNLDENDSDHSDTEVDYLCDIWIIDIETGIAVQSTTSPSDEEDDNDSRTTTLYPCRGSKLYRTLDGNIYSFGGYYGSNDQFLSRSKTAILSKQEIEYMLAPEYDQND